MGVVFSNFKQSKLFNLLIFPYKLKYSAKCKLDFWPTVDNNMWKSCASIVGNSLNFMLKNINSICSALKLEFTAMIS